MFKKIAVSLILRRNPWALGRGMNAFLGFLLRRKPRTLAYVASLALVFTLGLNGLVFAAESNITESSAPANPEKAINVGNKICPVTGDKIDEKNKVTYEYKGKIYNFCCPGCPEEFKKDPEKYIKKIEEEKQKEQAEEKEMKSGMEHHNHEGRMH